MSSDPQRTLASPPFDPGSLSTRPFFGRWLFFRHHFLHRIFLDQVHRSRRYGQSGFAEDPVDRLLGLLDDAFAGLALIAKA